MRLGSTRVLKADIRPGHDDMLASKVRSIEERDVASYEAGIEAYEIGQCAAGEDDFEAIREGLGQPAKQIEGVDIFVQFVDVIDDEEDRLIRIRRLSDQRAKVGTKVTCPPNRRWRRGILLAQERRRELAGEHFWHARGRVEREPAGGVIDVSHEIGEERRLAVTGGGVEHGDSTTHRLVQAREKRAPA